MGKVMNCYKSNHINSYSSKEELYNKINKNTKIINVNIGKGMENVLKKTNKKNVLINLDFDINEIDNAQKEKIIRKIIKIKNMCRKQNLNFGVVEKDKTVIANISSIINKIDEHNEIIIALNAVLIDDVKEKYNYIYSRLCDYLDDIFIKNNVCEFENNECIEKRGTGVIAGCCLNYKNKILGPLLPTKFIVCKYQQNGACSIRCLECKLYTCDTLRKKGIKFTVNNVVLIKTFFNIIQRLVIRMSIYTPQENVVNRLILTRFY